MPLKTECWISLRPLDINSAPTINTIVVNQLEETEIGLVTNVGINGANIFRFGNSGITFKEYKSSGLQPYQLVLHFDAAYLFVNDDIIILNRKGDIKIGKYSTSLNQFPDLYISKIIGVNSKLDFSDKIKEIKQSLINKFIEKHCYHYDFSNTWKIEKVLINDSYIF